MPACHKIQMKLSSVQPVPEGRGCGAGVGGGAELGVLINKFQKVIMNCLWLRLDRKLYCKAVKVTGATMRRGEERRGEERRRASWRSREDRRIFKDLSSANMCSSSTRLMSLPHFPNDFYAEVVKNRRKFPINFDKRAPRGPCICNCCPKMKKMFVAAAEIVVRVVLLIAAKRKRERDRDGEERERKVTNCCLLGRNR